MKSCTRCGKKAHFYELFFQDPVLGTVCQKCRKLYYEEKAVAEEQAREAAERAAQEAREAAERAAQEAREAAEDLHTKLVSLYKSISCFNRFDGIQAAYDWMVIRDEFIALCNAAIADDFYQSIYGETYDLGYSGWPHPGGRAYLASTITKVNATAKKIQAFIDNTQAFSKRLMTIPRCDIQLGPSTYIPDEDPDYSAVSFGKITKNTTREKVCDYIVVDVETTGLRAAKDEIIQLAAIKFNAFEPVDCFCTYIKPHAGINPEAEAVNHITEDMVKDAPTIDQVINAFRDYIGKSLPLVGHNLLFDLKFLCNAGCITLTKRRKLYDTLPLSKKSFNSEDNKYNLDYLTCCALNIARDDSHDALSDCLATGMLFAEICRDLD